MQENRHNNKHIFDTDRFLQALVGASLLLLVFRVLFTFLFALLLAQKWHLRWIFDGWIPIVAFNADPLTFAQMNGWSLLATAGMLFLFLLVYVLRRERYRSHKAWALYVSVLMAGMQYVVLYFLQDAIHFGVQGGLWWSFGLLALGASGILYIRQRLR